MINQIELGGKVRPILFGNYVFRKMKTEQGIGLAEILKGLDTFEVMDFNILSNMVYYALRAGEMANNLSPDTFTADNVSIWMDLEQGVLLKILPWVNESITSMVTDKDAPVPSESEAEDAKKKN
jgi:hypothetical protein